MKVAEEQEQNEVPKKQNRHVTVALNHLRKRRTALETQGKAIRGSVDGDRRGHRGAGSSYEHPRCVPAGSVLRGLRRGTDGGVLLPAHSPGA